MLQELVAITAALCIEDGWLHLLEKSLLLRLVDALKSAWIHFAMSVGRSGEQGVLASGLVFYVPGLEALDVMLRVRVPPLYFISIY